MQQYTLRRAFRRWKMLHGEECSDTDSMKIRVPSWFGYEIRKICPWTYKCNRWDCAVHLYKSKDDKRKYNGIYTLIASDNTLLKIERPVYPKIK